MAIYNNNNNETNTKLDELLEVCDYMLDVVNEGGGARKRYTEILDKKVDRIEKTNNYQKDLNKRFPNHIPEISMRDLEDLDKSKGNLDKYRSMIGGQLKSPWDKEHKNNFKNDFYSKGVDKLAERKPNSVKELQDKKRAIKETCEYILSVIDEM